MQDGILVFLSEWLRGNLLALIGYEFIVDLIMLGVKIGAILFVIMNAALFLTYGERKVCAFMQVRLGPNRVGGRLGLLQPVADAMKLMSKEDIIPKDADRWVWGLSPLLAFVPAAMVYAFVPFDAGAFFADLNIGLFLLIAISAQTVIPMLMGGFGSNNKYATIGGMRVAAQLISYDVPMVFGLLGVVMITGSLKMSDIVAAQSDCWFAVMQPIPFIIYMITAVAESNRAPFNLVEGESEIIAGPFTDYSGMRWALYFLAEYANLLAISILTTTLFLGGWHGPAFLPGFVWFWLKVLVMLFVYMWYAWTYPRIRIDHMLSLCWKVLLPLALVNVVLTGIGIYLYHLWF